MAVRVEYFLEHYKELTFFPIPLMMNHMYKSHLRSAVSLNPNLNSNASKYFVSAALSRVHSKNLLTTKCFNQFQAKGVGEFPSTTNTS